MTWTTRQIGTVTVLWPDDCLHDPVCTWEPWPWGQHSTRCHDHNDEAAGR